MKILVLLLISVTLLTYQACGGEPTDKHPEDSTRTDPTATPSSTPAPTLLTNPALKALQTNRLIWESIGFDDYQYDYWYAAGMSVSLCREALTIMIRNDEVQEAECGGHLQGVEGYRYTVKEYTVHGLFGLVENFLTNPELKDFDVLISYHNEIGYPTSITSEAPANWFDADSTILDSNLIPVE